MLIGARASGVSACLFAQVLGKLTSKPSSCCFVFALPQIMVQMREGALLSPDLSPLCSGVCVWGGGGNHCAYIT